jgi:hypothetical protein
MEEREEQAHRQRIVCVKNAQFGRETIERLHATV